MLKSLQLENFRNHQKISLDLSQTTVIIGCNGAGKSNIVEAIVMLSFCRPFRNVKKQNLIHHQADFARITGDDQEVFLCNVPKFYLRAKIKGAWRKLSDFVGYLPAVVFSPETLSLISGVPQDRRRFLDIMISQVDREYLEAIMNFEKIKKQRNHLLKAIKHGTAQTAELPYWDAEFIAWGKQIAQKRAKSIEYLNTIISDYYRKISDDKAALLSIEYVRNYDDLSADLAANQRRDIVDERTSAGPHRDDLVFNLNNRDLSKFASRGEIKSAVLSVKIAELNFLENKRAQQNNWQENTKPMLLLDDVFSEFDPQRRQHLSELILDYQSIITTTDKSYLSKELLASAKIIEL